MVMFDNSPRVTIDRLLADAAGDRARGCNTSDVDVLKEHLGEVLKELATAQLQNEQHGATKERDDETIEGLKAAVDCGLTSADRKAGKLCDEDDCAACVAVQTKREKDCGATDKERREGLCLSASDLGIDRCRSCAEHRTESRYEAERDALEATIEQLKAERATSPSDDAATIATLRADLATAKARHDCGRTDRETSGEPCPRRDAPGGCCDECFMKAAFADVARVEASKRETLLREIDGLNNRVQELTRERDSATVEAQSRPVARGKVKPTAEQGPSLFDRLPMATPPTETKAKKSKRAGVKKYPLAGKVPS